ncbi:MAG: hypothetical protein LUF04_00530 [Bacteroides sp.]|nr:hypothetical protein [Bacteroides sp.]
MHLTETYTEQLLCEVGEMTFPGFFVTAEVLSCTAEFPVSHPEFLREKHQAITEKGISGRIFSFRENGWHIRFTFFPTDRVVEERYAWKNRVVRRR